MRSELRIGGRAVRDFRFISLERIAGIRGTRGRSAGEGSDLRGLVQIQPGRAWEGRQPRAVFGVQLKHAQDKSCGLRR